MDKFYDIPGYDGYQINKNGDVYSLKRKKNLAILGPYDSMPYKVVGLCIDGKIKPVALHRLLAITFVDNPNNGIVVDHIDRDKLNNDIENLRWVSIPENLANRELKKDKDPQSDKEIDVNKLELIKYLVDCILKEVDDDCDPEIYLPLLQTIKYTINKV